jgi:GDSL-like Lipase/Acylhydrolase
LVTPNSPIWNCSAVGKKRLKTPWILVFNQFYVRSTAVSRIIQSTPLVDSQHADAAAFNQRVNQLNAILIQYAEFFNIRFMDLNAAMPHTDAYRLADGIHFNAAVYAKWAELAALYMLNGKQQSIHSNPQSLVSPLRLW